MVYLTFKFTNDILSPPDGTYLGVKSLQEAIVPAHPDLQTLTLASQKYEQGVNLHAIELVSEKGKFIDLKPLVWTPTICRKESLEVQPGERIVSARVQVDKRNREHPTRDTLRDTFTDTIPGHPNSGTHGRASAPQKGTGVL